MPNNLEGLVSQSVSSLKTGFSDYRLLLIHPSSRHHTLLIAAILNNPFSPVVYYSISSDDNTLSALISNLSRAIGEQGHTFGMGIPRLDPPLDYMSLAASVSDELKKMFNQEYIFILDEYDRIDGNEEIEHFFEELILSLPSQCHILINSRTLPRLPWVSLVAKNQAIVLRDSHVLSTGFYHDRSEAESGVEVYCFGAGQIFLNGELVNTWDGNLPRLLFFFILDKSTATRGEICENLWPELPLTQAVNVFHVTKRRLHKAIGRDVLFYENGLYRIDPSLNAHYDVIEFVSALASSRTAEDLEIKAKQLMTAIEIYKGHFLQGFDESWVVRRRNDFRCGYVEALVSLAGIREVEGFHESALALLLRAAAEAPDREDIHREVIRLFGLLGRRIEAAEYYNEMKAVLHDRYHLQPAEETQQVYRDAIGR